MVSYRQLCFTVIIPNCSALWDFRKSDMLEQTLCHANVEPIPGLTAYILKKHSQRLLSPMQYLSHIRQEESKRPPGAAGAQHEAAEGSSRQAAGKQHAHDTAIL